MGGMEISALKKEYQQMVLNKQDTYNPDYNSILDENEIKVLMDATGVTRKEELLANAGKEDLARRIANGIHVKKVVKDGNFNGTYEGGSVGVGFGSNGNVGVGVGGESGTVNGEISRTIETDFYEGMLITDVKESVFKSCFRDLDLNNNGELSSSEIYSYKNYVKNRNIINELNEELMIHKCRNTTPLISGCMAGGVGAIAGGIATHGILTSIVDKLGDFSTYWDSCRKDFPELMAKYKDHVLLDDRLLVGINPKKYKIYKALKGSRWQDGIGTGLSRSLTAMGVIAGAALLGYGVYKLVSMHKSVKEAKEQMPKLKAEIEHYDNLIGNLRNQYKNIDG